MTAGELGESSTLGLHVATHDAKGDFAKHVGISHGTFRCRRGYDLYTTTYQPLKRRTSACLVFHHGLSDHAARHSNVLTHLCASLGMPIYTYDAHGHGLSGPPGPTGRSLIRYFSHMVDDLVDFTKQVVVSAEEAANWEEEDEEEEVSEPLSSEALAQAAEAEGMEVVDACEVGLRLRRKGQQQQQDGAEGRKVEKQQQGNGQGRRKPRIFLMGYSMGGLACCLAVATTSPASVAAAPTPCAGTRSPVASCSAPAAAAAAAACKSSEDCPDKPGGSCTNCKGASVEEAAAAANGRCAAAATTAAASSSASCGGLYEGLLLTSGLTDPMYGTPLLLRLIKVAFVTAVAHIAPALPLLRRNPVESGIRDPAAVAQMAADALWYRGKFKAATVASLLWGCARLRLLVRRIRLPLYVQHATVDISCSLPSMQAFLGRIASRDVTLHVVQGAYHDLHHDPETPVLLGRMVEWLRARV